MATEAHKREDFSKLTSSQVLKSVQNLIQKHSATRSDEPFFQGNNDHFLRITHMEDGRYLLTLGNQIMHPVMEHKPTKRDPDNMEETRHMIFEWQQGIVGKDSVVWSAGGIEWGNKEQIDETTGKPKTDAAGNKITKPGYVSRSLSGGIKIGSAANGGIIDMISFSPPPPRRPRPPAPAAAHSRPSHRRYH